MCLVSNSSSSSCTARHYRGMCSKLSSVQPHMLGARAPTTTCGMQVWQYEGNETLWDVMQKRDFPYNVEPLLLGRTLDIAKSHRRRLISIRLILRQVCMLLKASGLRAAA